MSDKNVFSLDELTALLKARYPDDAFRIEIFEHPCGCCSNILYRDGAPAMTWFGRPVKTPVFDGVTKKGEREYYGVECLEGKTLRSES